MPLPGGADDGFDVGESDFPIEFVLGLAGVGIELRGIAGSPGRLFHGNLTAADGFHRRDYFAHRGGGAGPEIIEQGLARLFELGEGGDMGPAQVVDMYVVAQTGAVGRGIVVTEHLDAVPLTQRDLKHHGDDVVFRVVVLADARVGRRAGGVEVAQCASPYTPRLG